MLLSTSTSGCSASQRDPFGLLEQCPDEFPSMEAVTNAWLAMASVVYSESSIRAGGDISTNTTCTNRNLRIGGKDEDEEWEDTTSSEGDDLCCKPPATESIAGLLDVSSLHDVRPSSHHDRPFRVMVARNPKTGEACNTTSTLFCGKEPTIEIAKDEKGEHAAPVVSGVILPCIHLKEMLASHRALTERLASSARTSLGINNIFSSFLATDGTLKQWLSFTDYSCFIGVEERLKRGSETAAAAMKELQSLGVVVAGGGSEGPTSSLAREVSPKDVCETIESEGLSCIGHCIQCGPAGSKHTGDHCCSSLPQTAKSDELGSNLRLHGHCLECVRIFALQKPALDQISRTHSSSSQGYPAYCLRYNRDAENEHEARRSSSLTKEAEGQGAHKQDKGKLNHASLETTGSCVVSHWREHEAKAKALLDLVDDEDYDTDTETADTNINAGRKEDTRTSAEPTRACSARYGPSVCLLDESDVSSEEKEKEEEEETAQLGKNTNIAGGASSKETAALDKSSLATTTSSDSAEVHPYEIRARAHQAHSLFSFALGPAKGFMEIVYCACCGVFAPLGPFVAKAPGTTNQHDSEANESEILSEGTAPHFVQASDFISTVHTAPQLLLKLVMAAHVLRAVERKKKIPTMMISSDNDDAVVVLQKGEPSPNIINTPEEHGRNESAANVDNGLLLVPMARGLDGKLVILDPEGGKRGCGRGIGGPKTVGGQCQQEEEEAPLVARDNTALLNQHPFVMSPVSDAIDPEAWRRRLFIYKPSMFHATCYEGVGTEKSICSRRRKVSSSGSRGIEAMNDSTNVDEDEDEVELDRTEDQPDALFDLLNDLFRDGVVETVAGAALQGWLGMATATERLGDGNDDNQSEKSTTCPLEEKYGSRADDINYAGGPSRRRRSHSRRSTASTASRKPSRRSSAACAPQASRTARDHDEALGRQITNDHAAEEEAQICDDEPTPSDGACADSLANYKSFTSCVSTHNSSKAGEAPVTRRRLSTWFRYRFHPVSVFPAPAGHGPKEKPKEKVASHAAAAAADSIEGNSDEKVPVDGGGRAAPSAHVRHSRSSSVATSIVDHAFESAYNYEVGGGEAVEECEAVRHHMENLSSIGIAVGTYIDPLENLKSASALVGLDGRPFLNLSSFDSSNQEPAANAHTATSTTTCTFERDLNIHDLHTVYGYVIEFESEEVLRARVLWLNEQLQRLATNGGKRLGLGEVEERFITTGVDDFDFTADVNVDADRGSPSKEVVDEYLGSSGSKNGNKNATYEPNKKEQLEDEFHKPFHTKEDFDTTGGVGAKEDEKGERGGFSSELVADYCRTAARRFEQRELHAIHMSSFTVPPLLNELVPGVAYLSRDDALRLNGGAPLPDDDDDVEVRADENHSNINQWSEGDFSALLCRTEYSHGRDVYCPTLAQHDSTNLQHKTNQNDVVSTEEKNLPPSSCEKNSEQTLNPFEVIFLADGRDPTTGRKLRMAHHGESFATITSSSSQNETLPKSKSITTHPHEEHAVGVPIKCYVLSGHACKGCCHGTTLSQMLSRYNKVRRLREAKRRWMLGEGFSGSEELHNKNSSDALRGIAQSGAFDVSDNKNGNNTTHQRGGRMLSDLLILGKAELISQEQASMLVSTNLPQHFSVSKHEDYVMDGLALEQAFEVEMIECAPCVLRPPLVVDFNTCADTGSIHRITLRKNVGGESTKSHQEEADSATDPDVALMLKAGCPLTRSADTFMWLSRFLTIGRVMFEAISADAADLRSARTE